MGSSCTKPVSGISDAELALVANIRGRSIEWLDVHKGSQPFSNAGPAARALAISINPYVVLAYMRDADPSELAQAVEQTSSILSFSGDDNSLETALRGQGRII